MGENPGEDADRLWSGGWCATGLELGACTFEVVGGDCCFTGERAGSLVGGDDGWDVVPLIRGV